MKTNARLDAEIARIVDANPGFRGFASWPDVVRAAGAGERLWYQAPMDLRPRSVLVTKVYKNGKLRVDPMSNQAHPFTADEGHLGRFFARVG